ncbi:MAG: SDR family oxidoreductase [Chloroflexi bacterium]|nr:SDR family oxidoreductase [Chloroflexota bacterium]
MPEHVAYCVSKAAVVQLTRIFAVALAPMKINVNCVNPGLVEGGMLAGALNKPAERKRLEGYQPWGRFAKPEEIADAVAYLASDAADFVTGSAFTIDGGRMLEFIRT